MKRCRITRTLAVPLAAALLLSACGAVKDASDNSGTTSPTSGPDSSAAAAPGGSASSAGPVSRSDLPSESGGTAGSSGQALADQLPPKIRDAGVIKVATGASYPPDQYVDKDGSTIVGWSVDLLNEAGRRLGVKMEFSNIDFPGILPAIESHKFDLGSSSYAVTDDRRKAVDFVTYFQNGQYIAVQKGNPKSIDPTSVCGKKFAVTQGALAEKTATALSEKCVAEGKPAVDINGFPNGSAVYLALSSGRADLTVVNGSTLGNLPEQIETLGDSFMPSTVGFIFAKDSGQLRDAMHLALQQMIEDGSYLKILKKWGIENGAVESSDVIT